MDPPAGPFLVLLDAGGPTERALLADWVRESGVEAVAVLPVRGPELATRLAEVGDDVGVTAARVAWLPRDQARGRSRRLGGRLTALAYSRRPPEPARAAIARRQPHRVAVAVAESASVGELRTRWEGTRRSGSLADHVRRQALLALDRAERAVVGDRFKVPREIVESIETSPAFGTEVAALAARLDLPEPEVAGRAVADLQALVASMSPAAVDVLTTALRPLHARAWTVEADSAGLERLRERGRHHALVFLPSHRSYADPLLLADVLAAHDFPRNHVLGGDNLRFWPLGPLAKRAGIVFIRRSFGDDEVYKLAVREYFGFLLSKRFNLEWYMEGGRSRTGKLRPPRYGLLANVAEAVESGRTGDVYLVPVSIAYDQLREVAAMAAEQRGAAKQGEGLSWLASYARAQLQQVGTAHVRFAEPISLGSHLNGPGTEADRRLALQKVAFEVAVGINNVTPVMATALVTLTLLGVRDRALTLRQVRAVLEPLRDYVVERDLPRSGEPLGTDAGLRGVLAALAAEGVVTAYTGGAEPVYAIEPGRHLVAAFYRNSAIHHFVDRAIAELMLLCDPQHRTAEAARLRDLLKFEFFFPEREVHTARLAEELARFGADEGSGRMALRRAGFLCAHRVLRSFVDAQLVVAERLAAREPHRPVAEQELLDECGGVGQQMLLQGRLHGPESLSRELFASALRLAANRDLVGSDHPELAERRSAFADQVRDVVARVTEIDEIDATSRREGVGVEP